jgi:hypothetical protein
MRGSALGSAHRARLHSHPVAWRKVAKRIRMGAGASTGNPGGGAPANAGAAAPPPARRSGKSSSIGAKLALAAKEGDKEKVETLLGMAGSDPNAIDPATGNTALHFAAAMGHVRILQFFTLCSMGEDGLPRVSNRLVLTHACEVPG